MAVHDYVLDNATGANFRSDLNNALAAIVSNNSNSSEPSTKYAYQWWVDTTANIVKIRNSANDGWINLFTTAGGIDVDAASNFAAAVTFTDDVTFDGATAGRDIVFDRSDNALEFADNAKAKFGADGDLEIYHNGSNSYVAETGTGVLVLSGSAGVYIQKHSHDETMAAFLHDGAVELYHNNLKKAETVSGGFTVTGTCTATAFAGDGSALTGVGATTINNNADNRVITGSGSTNTLEAEAGMTFDGSSLTLEAAAPAIIFDENNANPDYKIQCNGGAFSITDTTNSETRYQIKSNGYTVLQNDIQGQFQVALKNLDDSNTASGYALLSWNYNRSGGGIDQAAGYIYVIKNQAWATTSANSDAAMVFGTIENESITEKMRIRHDGHLLIGTTSDNIGNNAATEGIALREEGHVVSRGTSSNVAMFTSKVTDTGGSKALRIMLAQTEMGSITYGAGGTAFNTSSDYRRKENVVDLTNAITRIKTLLPKRFNFIDEPSVTRDGFLAHEVTAVPEAVTGAKDEVATETDVQRGVTDKVGDPIYQQLDNSKLIPLLVASVKELIARVETLEAA